MIRALVIVLCVCAAFSPALAQTETPTPSPTATPGAPPPDADPTSIGWLIPYVTESAPPGCLPANGSSYLRTDYPDLYAAIDSALRIDADFFKTPDVRGRAVIGVGEGVGLTARTPNMTGGAESVTLTVDQVPAHDHTVTLGETTTGTATEPGTLSVMVPTGGTTVVTSSQTGGGDPVDIMPPFVALNWCVLAIQVLPPTPLEGVVITGTRATTTMGTSNQEVAFNYEMNAGDVAVVVGVAAVAMMQGISLVRGWNSGNK